MDFSNIIQESRVDDFKVKFSNKFSPEQLDKIVDNAPQKYLDWVGKNFESINFNSNFQDLVLKLREFDKISSNLPKTDINSYKNLTELYQALNDYANRSRREIRKVEGGNVVHEDDRFFVVNPLTHGASCYYGKGTKWCTAADSDYQFKQYNEDGKLFYILDKTKATSDPLYKIALLKKFDGNVIVYDAQDNETKILPAILGKEKYDEIMSNIDSYLEQEYSEQLKIYRDKESAKKEKERLYRLRAQAILREKEEAAEERRTEGEWELGPNCPDEGLKAHALLNQLVDDGDVEVLTNEDRIEIQRLKDEIESLQAEYDADEELRGDLLDEISDLEGEIDEFDDRIDVYNIIPVGKHYDLQQFEVINSNVDGNTYAVGDEDEMQSSCYEYVEQLIDDIGYEGFSNGFARDYIDSDAVASYAEDVYDDDVRNNPDSYFSDEDRSLSDEQQEEIEILRNKIQQTETLRERLEGEMDGGEDDDETQENIDELTERIEEMENEITDIEEDPSGEFPEDMITEKIEELVSDVKDDPEGFMETFGLNWEDYIDKDDFIKGVIDADGYGHTMSTYDGNADEVYVQDKLFYVIRID
jgi:hypothetical protein